MIMSARTMTFEDHHLELTDSIASLFRVKEVTSKHSDVQIKVGLRSFYCHKLVLQLGSEYFADSAFTDMRLHRIHSDAFYEVLRFMYTGKILLSTDNIEAVLSAADFLRMGRLKVVCVRFLENTLATDNVLQCWQLSEAYELTELALKCQGVVVSNFKKFRSSFCVKNTSENMVKVLLRADELSVKNEVEVCETLLDWIAAKEAAEEEVHLEQLLPLIRWSGIGVDYIRSKFLQNKSLISNDVCLAFLSKVITYKTSDMALQFTSLRTFHRLSTGLENCIVAVGINDGVSISEDVLRIDLQERDSVSRICKIPTTMNGESRCCGYQNDIYVTGTGGEDTCNETWRYNSLSGWSKCADMISGRRRHCAVFVDFKLFVLGGCVPTDNTTLESVEYYHILEKRWLEAGNLQEGVQSAACVAYKNCIYVFGGTKKDKDTAVNHVQVYDPSREKCLFLNDVRMPRPHLGMRAVLWETSAILMGHHTCFLYNFETREWQERKQYKMNVSHFSLVLDNETVYIAGGATCPENRGPRTSWTFNDEIKCLPVAHIVDDNLNVQWRLHAKLPKPCIMPAYGLTSLPRIKEV